MDDEIELTGAASFDAAHFRTVLGHFCSGVVIVTGMESGTPVGFTAQSFFSLSLDPPLVGLAPAKTSTSWPRVRASGNFCVNVLSEDQEEVCRAFARSGADKFSSVGWRHGLTGSPILNGVLAWIDCRLEDEHEGGDHTIAVGRAVELDMAPRGRPLLFYRGGYGRFDS